MKTPSASDILHRRYLQDNPAKALAVEEYQTDQDVAAQIYSLREDLNLTQAELASRIGTTASAISRLEDAEYEGHSLGMLRRIAEACGKTVRISFQDKHPLSAANRSSIGRLERTEVTAGTSPTTVTLERIRSTSEV
jgi:transcriptional regulator with XRE-family HTH domain